jgi:tetratricopeptide (TPR) repeat protein
VTDPSHERRQHLLRRCVALGIVLMGAATAVVSLFHPSTGVSLALLLGSQAFTVGSWALGVIDEEVDRRAKEDEEQHKLDMGLWAAPRTVHFTNPYRAGVVRDSKRAMDHLRPGDEYPPYVAREVDEWLRRALTDDTTRRILVGGMPRVGKGRSTFEAAASAVPDHWLVVPRHFQGLDWFRHLRPPCPKGAPVLLWLDDLELFVRPGGLPAAWLDGWAAATPEVRVVALMRTDRLPELTGPEPDELRRPLQDALARFRQAGIATALTVPRDHTTDERVDIERLYAGERLSRGKALGDHLVTVDEHLQRFCSSEHSRPEGFLVVWACAVAQHLLRKPEVSAPMLADVYQQGLGRRPTTRRLTMDQFDAGVRFATAAFGDGIDGMLTSREAGTTWYGAPDYLVAYVVERLLDPDWLARGVPDDIWQAVLDRADEFDELMMALVAHDQGRRDRALEAWRRALRSDSSTVSTNAAIGLALLERERAGEARSGHRRRERLEHAVDLLEWARQLGDPYEGPHANRFLGDVLTDLERFDRAEAAYERARSSRSPDERARATWRLGTLYRDHLGRPDAARELLRQAAESDHYEVAPRAALELGTLLVRSAPRGGHRARDERTAERWLERAIRNGPRDVAAQASLELAEARRGSDPAMSERLYRQALRLDEATVAPRAGLRLGELLLGRDPDRAGSVFRQVADNWMGRLGPEDAFQVGVALDRCGDPDGARTAYRHLVDHGSGPLAGRAAVRLGRLQVAAGDHEGARASFRAALDRADPADGLTAVAAMGGLGDVLRDRAPAEAARWYEQALDRAAAARFGLPHKIGRGPIHSSAEEQELVDRAARGYRQALGRIIEAEHPTELPDAAARLAGHLAHEPGELHRLVARIDRVADRTMRDTAKLRMADALRQHRAPQEAADLSRQLIEGESRFAAEAGTVLRLAQRDAAAAERVARRAAAERARAERAAAERADDRARRTPRAEERGRDDLGRGRDIR